MISMVNLNMIICWDLNDDTMNCYIFSYKDGWSAAQRPLKSIPKSPPQSLPAEPLYVASTSPSPPRDGSPPRSPPEPPGTRPLASRGNSWVTMCPTGTIDSRNICGRDEAFPIPTSLRRTTQFVQLRLGSLYLESLYLESPYRIHGAGGLWGECLPPSIPAPRTFRGRRLIH